MTVKEIRESGLLEYYVLGTLSEQEVAEVEGYLLQFPELQKDYLEIQRATQNYAQFQKVKPQRNLERDILNSIRSSKEEINPNDNKEATRRPNHSKAKESSNWIKKTFLFILGAITILSIWRAWKSSNEFNLLRSEYQTLADNCDENAQEQQRKIDMYEQLSDPKNRTININPSPAYPETELLFHLNDLDQENFIQLKNLPIIASNQVFQLWSLKDGIDPIPLSIFRSDGELLIPVDFEEGTNTYAITIEAEGGALVPTLSRLIGTISV